MDRELRDAYRALFRPPATEPGRLGAARLVLADLRRHARCEIQHLAGGLAFHPDPRQDSYLAGVRWFYYYLLQSCELSDEECDRHMLGNPIEGGPPQ